MWLKVNPNRSNIEHGKTYKTATLTLDGQVKNEQRMMFLDGLWWVGTTYVYYSQHMYG